MTVQYKGEVFVVKVKKLYKREARNGVYLTKCILVQL